MTNRIHMALAWMLASISALLTLNARPAPEPVVRFNEHPGVKRVYSRALGVTALARALAGKIADMINAPLRSAGFALSPGTLNTFLEPLPTFEFQAAAKKNDLPRGLYLEMLTCVLSGNFTVTAGGGTAGTLLDEPIARLIKSLRVVWDGVNLVQLSGRELVALSKRVQAQTLTSADITTAGVQDTDFSLPFQIPFVRKYLADPFDTVLPPLAVNSEFAVEVIWNNDKANSETGTTAGSGAIVTGGDNVCILSDVQLTVTPHIARNGKAPWMLPVISSYDTQQFSAAGSKLPLDMRSPLPFDSVLLRTFEGANLDVAALINAVTFKSAQTQIYNDVPVATLRAIEESNFPGVSDADEVGTHMLAFAAGGKLGNAVNPAELNNPTFEFNVTAPSSNPGFIRAVVMELLSVPGVTRK